VKYRASPADKTIHAKISTQNEKKKIFNQSLFRYSEADHKKKEQSGEGKNGDCWISE